MDVIIDGSSDGSTLWVNNETTCIARFSTKFGVDMHHTVEDQLAGSGQCLWCTHEPPDYATWQKFIGMMKDVYEVVIDPDHIDVGLLRRK